MALMTDANGHDGRDKARQTILYLLTMPAIPLAIPLVLIQPPKA
jgi:hypothetical protein